MVDRLTSPKDSSKIGLGNNNVAYWLTQLGNRLYSINNILNQSPSRRRNNKWMRELRNLDYYIIMFPWAYIRAYGGLAIETVSDGVATTANLSQDVFYSVWDWAEQNEWIFWIKE